MLGSVLRELDSPALACDHSQVAGGGEELCSPYLTGQAGTESRPEEWTDELAANLGERGCAWDSDLKQVGLFALAFIFPPSVSI